MEKDAKLTILAVDDQPVVLHTIMALLQKEFRVIPVANGFDALKYLSKQPVDLVLTDINMPEMDGYELLAKLRNLSGCLHLPVMFLTGQAGDEAELEALSRGAVDYISKPIRASVLLSRVHTQIELKERRIELEELVMRQTREIVDAYGELKKRQGAIFNLLAGATDCRDSCTGDHIVRTYEFVRLMLDALSASEKAGYFIDHSEREKIANSTKIHDIGKIGIPDEILSKNGKLTEAEFEIIKTHTTLGGDILKRAIGNDENNSFLDIAYEIAVKHHEKWNGTGYPYMLSGTDIPLSARIMAVADVYDALISERPYKKAFPHDKAVEIIREGAGSHFDPYLVEIFMSIHTEFDEICKRSKNKTAE